MNAPLPADDDASQRARTVLCALLAGFGLGPGEARAALVDQLMAEACARWPEPSGRSLAQCALEHAEGRFEAWLGAVLGPEALGERPALLVGRAAFLLCDGPTRWSELMLVRDHLPAAFVDAMRGALPPPTPAPTPGGMLAQSLESWSLTDAVVVVGEQLAMVSGGRVAIPALINRTP